MTEQAGGDGIAANREPVFEFTGGSLCLDFANTARYSPPARENLGRYADLVAWGQGAGALTRARAKQLLTDAASSPDEAEKVLERARVLREAIYRTFSSIAASKPPSPADTAILSDAAVEAGQHFRIVRKSGAYAWEIQEMEREPLERPLWPVARSAAELLTSGEAVGVRECALETCSWLFLDRSKNHKRRWCDMKICGNRSKARRHYEKSRAAPRPPRRPHRRPS